LPLNSKSRGSDWFRIRLFTSLPPDLGLQADRLWYDNFRAGKSQQELKDTEDRYFSTPFAFLLALEDPSVIGTLLLFKRKIDYKGEPILLGGIGNLCTKKEKRRMGVATALLKRAMKELAAQNCDVAYLCTDINDPAMVKLYTGVGFVPLNKPYSYLGRSGKRYTETDGMVAPIQSKEKFDLILNGKEPLDLDTGNW
jgi:GNAT superfamily N-acetyltransferase